MGADLRAPLLRQGAGEHHVQPHPLAGPGPLEEPYFRGPAVYRPPFLSAGAGDWPATVLSRASRSGSRPGSSAWRWPPALRHRCRAARHGRCRPDWVEWSVMRCCACRRVSWVIHSSDWGGRCSPQRPDSLRPCCSRLHRVLHGTAIPGRPPTASTGCMKRSAARFRSAGSFMASSASKPVLDD